VGKGNSPYPHHTLLKAAIDGVKDTLAVAEDEHTDATTLKLGESIANAEAVLKKGLQAFPNEALLLVEEGELSKILSEAVRAETAFEKAFAANPRSTLIAKRLARIKRSKGAYADAQQVLHECLEFNPAAQDLRYDFAMSILESAPDADQVPTGIVAIIVFVSVRITDTLLAAGLTDHTSLLSADRTIGLE
jgi:tetratricopeptide (TPR) repeat protein